MSDPGQSLLPPSALARIQASTAAAGRKPLFTSDLSVDEFALVRDAGFEPVGLVAGNSVYHVGLQPQQWNVSQELTVLTQAMYTAREYALARMMAETEALGADGVIGLDLISSPVGGEGMMDFRFIGTAVRSTRGGNWRTPSGRPFSSELSGRDFWTLLQIGYAPVAWVFGTCVYHVAHQSFRQMMKQMGQNTELPQFTQAYYDARELAMARLQAEAERDQADGVVGVTTYESQHLWGEHAIEFACFGTAVRAIDPAANPPKPTFVMPMNG